VIYNGATEITDAEQLRTRFYANADTLISDMGGNLYYNFRAYNSGRSFFSVPLASQTSTVNAEITFDVTTSGRYEADGIPTSGAGFQVGQQITLLGSSLGASVIGYDPKQFSPESFKIMIDIDQNEIDKNIIKIDHVYHTSLKKFFGDVL
jgi:hypothetical protein